jgi:hypothetical protein
MGNSYPPSNGSIKPELVDVIKGTCEVMRSTGSPFMVNIYPFLARRDNPKDVSLDYCLFNGKVVDGSYTYSGIFHAMMDALYVALGRIGYGNLEVVIGESGWPTQGHEDATTGNAEKFNNALIRNIKTTGTPRFPNRPIRCFLFEMYDEDQKSVEHGPFEHYWGVYRTAGVPKYSLVWT